MHAGKWKKALSCGPDSSSGGSSGTGEFGGVCCPDFKVFFCFFLQELDLFPGEKPYNTMKITGYSPVSKSTGYKQDLCKREWRKMGRLG